jgi:hypothetical protein
MLITIALFSGKIYAQFSTNEINILNNEIYEKLVKENFIKFNRVTREGVISSCELEFQNTYRDIRAKQGSPIFTVGSFSVNYNKGKNLSYFLKVVPSEIDLNLQKWNVLKPAYTNISVKNKSLEKYKIADSNCDMGGKCSVYADTELKITTLLVSENVFDSEITLTLNKGGMDYSFKLSSLLPAQNIEKERMKFNNCTIEIIDKVKDDLEAIK